MTLLRRFASIAVVLVLCAPAAFVFTFLLTPLWSWIETAYGIESIGHSGPSEWCFYLIYFLGASAGLLTLRRVSWRSG